ncbi:DUF6297 family protein [Spirillospora sp. NPDC052269]
MSAGVRVGAARRTSSSWGDRYALGFGGLVVVLLLAPVVLDTLKVLGHSSDPARAGAGVALLGLLYAGFLMLARAYGPISVSAADAAWLLLSPLPRRRVLGRSALILVGVGVVGGLALGMGLLAALGAPDQGVLRLVAALTLGLAATVGGLALAVLGQASAAWDGRLRTAILAVAAAAVLAAVLSRPVGRAVQAIPASSAATAAAVCALAAALAARLAWSRLERIHARDLLEASTRVNRVATATTLLDPGSLTWTVEDVHWRGRTLRSHAWPRLPAPLAVAWQDWVRLGRRPGRLAVVAASAALPALAARAADGTSPMAMASLGALLVAASCAAGARRDAGDPALSRLTAVGPRATLAGRAVLPALVGGLWLALALAGLQAVGVLSGGPWWPLALPCAPALAAGALRMARRPPVDHAMPVIATPVGAIPTGPFLWAMTGADIALIGCAPALNALAKPPAGLGPVLVAQAVAGVAVLGLYLLKGGRPVRALLRRPWPGGCR